MDFEQRYTLPEMPTEELSIFTTAKLIATVTGAFFIGSAIAYGIYNYLVNSSSTSLAYPFYAQVSLQAINNRTLH